MPLTLGKRDSIVAMNRPALRFRSESADNRSVTTANDAVTAPVDTAPPDRELHKMWRPFDVLSAVVVSVVFCAVLWVGLTTGVDYIHIGHRGCTFSHDGFSHIQWQCGTGNTGSSVPVGNTGASIGTP